MSMHLNELIEEYSRLLDEQVFDPDDLDYQILNYHIPLLERIDVVESGCISVFDLYQRNHIYYSPKYETLLGWDTKLAGEDISYTNSMIHPDDLLQLFRAGIYYISLGFSLPDRTTSREYKTLFEYRVRGHGGEYVRIIEQQVPLEFDRKGNVWLALSMLDISPDQDLKAPFRGRLRNQRTGELFHFPPEEQEETKNRLTAREKEVLTLIAKGLISKEIADKLYISVNTVNTHRQNIIEKLNVSNTYEALRYANRHGIF